MADEHVIIDYETPAPRKRPACPWYSVGAVIWSLLSTPLTTFVPAFWVGDVVDDIVPRWTALAIVGLVLVGVPVGCILCCLVVIRRRISLDEGVPMGPVFGIIVGGGAAFMGALALFFASRW